MAVNAIKPRLPEQLLQQYQHLEAEALKDQSPGEKTNAVDALGSFIQSHQKNYDLRSAIEATDAAVILELKRCGYQKAVERITGAESGHSSRFNESGQDHSDAKRGIDQSAQTKAQVEALLTNEEMADAKARFEGTPGRFGNIGMEDSPEAQMFYKALAGGDPASLQAAFGPQLEAYRKSSDPELQAVARDFDRIVASQMGAKERLDAFGNNVMVKDAMAILLGNSRRMSRGLRDKIRNTEDVKSGNLKFSEKVEQIRGQIAESFKANRQKIINESEAAFKVDPNSEQFKKLPEAVRKQVLKDGSEAQEAYKEMMGAIERGEKPKPETLERLLAAADGPGIVPPSGVTNADLEGIPDDLQSVIKDVDNARNEWMIFEARNTRELMGILESNLPIEMIVALFLAKMGERQEKRLKLRMKEMMAAEVFEKKTQNLERKFEAAATPEARAEIEKEMGAVNEVMRKSNIKSLNAATQELQAEQTKAKQFNDAFQAVLRMIQDMAMTAIRNIR